MSTETGDWRPSLDLKQDETVSRPCATIKAFLMVVPVGTNKRCYSIVQPA